MPDPFRHMDEPIETERQLKRWRRAKKEALIAGDWSGLQALSRRGRRGMAGRFEGALYNGGVSVCVLPGSTGCAKALRGLDWRRGTSVCGPGWEGPRGLRSAVTHHFA